MNSLGEFAGSATFDGVSWRDSQEELQSNWWSLQEPTEVCGSLKSVGARSLQEFEECPK